MHATGKIDVTYMYPRMRLLLAQGCIHTNVRLRDVAFSSIKLNGTAGQSTQITHKSTE